MHTYNASTYLITVPTVAICSVPPGMQFLCMCSHLSTCFIYIAIIITLLLCSRSVSSQATVAWKNEGNFMHRHSYSTYVAGNMHILHIKQSAVICLFINTFSYYRFRDYINLWITEYHQTQGSYGTWQRHSWTWRT